MLRLFSIIFLFQLIIFSQSDKALENLVHFSIMYNKINSYGNEITESNLIETDLFSIKNDKNSFNYTDLLYKIGEYKNIILYCVQIPTHFDVYLKREIYWAYVDEKFIMLENNLEEFISMYLIDCEIESYETAQLLIKLYETVKFSKYNANDFLTEENLNKYPLEYDNYNKLITVSKHKEVWKMYIFSYYHTEEIISVKYIFNRNKISVEQKILSKNIK